ncbi:heterokaryon incompatibility protein-domain-containing protein [Lasiosphaeria miniovina]|uniref:Heterokaryon incompatibility protein-domain-containing protein n=1 Tax=Lasiosphaeria miniovina TaxID=1954250 RepID=A0AA40ADT8_9PEZI|nr:heterokaryon incompatibility protein-domain-containing protein [Lasiosphaeria miniovina]KAK0713942.1 heterokaryon incompatibility protein-domain-containing protein [Lasiosphaeria miniovina]
MAPPLYTPLPTDAKDAEIRLLTVFPADGGDPASVVCCSIRSQSESLAVALAGVRAHNAPNDFTIWADAICINQSDLAEKSSQVALMSSIYSSAARVVGWLGEAAGESNYAIELIARIRG